MLCSVLCALEGTLCVWQLTPAQVADTGAQAPLSVDDLDDVDDLVNELAAVSTQVSPVKI
jgi:hypothetical protein